MHHRQEAYYSTGNSSRVKSKVDKLNIMLSNKYTERASRLLNSNLIEEQSTSKQSIKSDCLEVRVQELERMHFKLKRSFEDKLQQVHDSLTKHEDCVANIVEMLNSKVASFESDHLNLNK